MHVTYSAVDFKSYSLTIPTLILNSGDLVEINLQLQQKITEAPDFFKYSPLIIDLNITITQTLDLQLLVQSLRQLQFSPIAIQGGSAKQQKIATRINLPILSNPCTNQLKINTDHPLSEPEPDLASSTIESKLVTRPIRSGQRVYAKGDLIILAPVSSGAEILAEGNIHVYASLRGRALAGVKGNQHSRIFCSDLQAELISIAGNYRIKDNLEQSMQHQLVQVFLHDQALIIKAL
jgi:septum site-determining protein MinC